jgi:hypothetical protein
LQGPAATDCRAFFGGGYLYDRTIINSHNHFSCRTAPPQFDFFLKNLYFHLTLIWDSFKNKFDLQGHQMKYLWWAAQVLCLLISIFFFIFGIDLIRGAYGLNDPFSFIMTFFAASFIILISLTLALVFIIKMIRVYRCLRPSKIQEDKS